jgi:hypothetical protein
VPDDVGPDDRYLAGLQGALQAKRGIIHEFDHDRFLPNFPQFIIRQASYNSNYDFTRVGYKVVATLL